MPETENTAPKVKIPHIAGIILGTIYLAYDSYFRAVGLYKSVALLLISAIMLAGLWLTAGSVWLCLLAMLFWAGLIFYFGLNELNYRISLTIAMLDDNLASADRNRKRRKEINQRQEILLTANKLPPSHEGRVTLH